MPGDIHAPSPPNPIDPISRSASTSSARRRFSIGAGSEVRSIEYSRSSARSSGTESRSQGLSPLSTGGGGLGVRRLLMRTRQISRHPQRRRPLPVAIGGSHLTGHHQTMPVIHEAVPQVAEERAGAAGLAEQPRLTVAAGAVGLVGEQQPPEISLGALPFG